MNRRGSAGFLRVSRSAVVLGAMFVLTLFGLKESGAALQKGPVHIGYTTSVVQDVRGQLGDAAPKKIVQAEKVFFNEAVITAKDSAIVIQFRDGSTFELGEDGAMTLDELVFNPFEGKSIKVMTLLQGSFRYVSGYVAKEAIVTLNTPSGTVGIRGSTMSGFYYAGQPVFIHVSKGEAIYRNAAGETRIRAGQSIAVVDRNTPPVEPERMPPAVAAQAMGHIQANLSKVAKVGAQTLTPEQRAADAAANAIPIAQQQEDLPAAPATPIELPEAVKVAAPVIPLLSEAAKVGVLAGGRQETTAAQQAFLEKADAAIPDAKERIEAATIADQAKNEANVVVGTTEVIAGSSENADSAEQIGTLVQASVGANPNATALIATTAVKSSAANDAVETTDVAAATTKGAVAGAIEAGADVSEITEAASKGAVTGAVAAGTDAAAAAGAATEGAVAGAAEVGADLGAVIKAAASGVVTGAVETGADAAGVAEAATKGAVTGAAAAGLDTGVAVKAATEGVAAGAVDAGIDAVSMIEAAINGAISGAQAIGGDLAAITEAVIQGAIEAGDALGIDVGGVTETAEAELAAAEVAAIESAAGPTDVDVAAGDDEPVEEVVVEVDPPEAENPAQDNVSPS